MSNTHDASPTRPEHTNSCEYRSAYVTDSQETLTRDIPNVPEVHLDSLMDAVLPSLPSTTLDELYYMLENDGHIKDLDTPNPRWTCLPRDPSDSSSSESETFRFLENISQAIIGSQPTDHTLNIQLKVADQITPINSRHTLRPDGYFQIVENANPGQPNWCDIVMPIELKSVRNRQNQIDDFGKIMWSMHHIMRNDPRRRYVHGLTCEDTKARLWYNDRADVVASQEFDVNKDWKCLVRIILSVLLATEVQLGYDPSIILVPHNDPRSEPCYDITVHNSDTGLATVYRTIRIISDAGADSMVGRGTRVWEVRRLVEGRLDGHSYALKDTWVHEDRVPEHAILQKIRSEQPAYAQHFLTPIDYGFAPRDPAQPLVLDNTHKTLRHQQLVPTRKLLPTHFGPPLANAFENTCSSSQESSVRDGVGHSDDIPDSPLEGHQAFCLSKHPRQHYRSVFKEIGTPVHDLRKFTDIFVAIQGGWKGLHAIHLCKYVHRDVSSGNILLVPAKDNLSERGVIMDLEYGKEVDDTSVAHDVRAGTVTFMATEVVFMDHHRFRTIHASIASDSSGSSDSEAGSAMEQGFDTPLKPIQVPSFHHNPLHDMESIWWLCIWMMFYLIKPSKDRLGHLRNYPRVFRNPDSKKSFITDLGSYDENTSHLSEHPKWVEAMKRWSLKLNNLYYKSYKEHDASAIPPKRIRIGEKDIDAAYKRGQRFLASLLQASTSLPEFVTLSEQLQAQAAPATRPSHRLTLDCVLLPAVTNSRLK